MTNFGYSDEIVNKRIRLEGVRQNNLKNINVEFPFKKISVITGLSGSGKSSLAFDTLYAEGQRRYIESLSTYTRQFLEKMPKPDLDRVENIPPAIALEQRNHVLNSRSTVGTQTEIVDYLRILYARAGKTHCIDCGGSVQKIDADTILNLILEQWKDRRLVLCAPLILPQSSAGKKRAKKAPTLSSLVALLQSQGFRRILYCKTPGKKKIHGTVLDLDDFGTDSWPKTLPKAIEEPSSFFIVIDRISLTDELTPGELREIRSRMSDSLHQALRAGHQQVSLFDPDRDQIQSYLCDFACQKCGKVHRVPEPNLFSFNNPLGACSRCSGFGHTLELSEDLVVPDPSKTIKNGVIDPLSKPSMDDWQERLFRFVERHGISIGKRYRDLTRKEKDLIWDGDPSDTTFLGIRGCFEALAKKKYKLHVRVFIRRYQKPSLCTLCKGARITRDALAVTIHGKTISDVLDMSIANAYAWFKDTHFTQSETNIGKDVFFQIDRRLDFLNRVGVGYLTLSRLTKTLSGGEFQRINLATQLGNGLCGTLYVLDEPSIGLHASDSTRLMEVLEDLRSQGNTVVMVEHDLEMIRKADWLIELGPGSGRRGGHLQVQGHARDLEENPESLTGQYLSGQASLKRSIPERGPPRKFLKITGCRENNLKNLSVEFPLERFVVVTGLSGSGKTTLVHKTLYLALAKLFSQRRGDFTAIEDAGAFQYLYGAENIRDVVLLDQKPIGKSSRSNPATYLKAWDEVRRVYANQVTALRRGYGPQYFSFNIDGGRCPVCAGEGEVTIDMHFMAEMKLPCEECEGRRFKKNILEITYRGKNVHQLLQSTIDDAYDHFRDNPILSRKLGILRDVGLGYLLLGQSGTTLSGGESQRLKIASALDQRHGERLLYIFDEPTTGLHMEDIKRLLLVLQDLVQDGNSIIMIEHHLDVIAQADWIIDLGPGGGENGGEIVAQGSPQDLVRSENSATGQLLNTTGKTILMPRALDLSLS